MFSFLKTCKLEKLMWWFKFTDHLDSKVVGPCSQEEAIKQLFIESGHGYYWGPLNSEEDAKKGADAILYLDESTIACRDFWNDCCGCNFTTATMFRRYASLRKQYGFI